MSPGLLFCACSFSKSPLYVLQEAVFPPTLIANCHPLFIHSQGKGIPSHVASPAIRILSLSYSDAENLVTWRRLQCNLTRICTSTWCRLQCNLTQITAWFASSWKLIWHRLECDMLQVAWVFLSFSIKVFNFATMNLDCIITYSVSARGGFLYLRRIQSI